MKILIAVDMEGITGVVNWNQVDPGHAEYNRFREIMTADVNAAIRGAYEAGAKEMIVSDGHSNGYNILIEKLDARAKLNSGNAAPFAMVQGIDESFNCAMFIGYHARVGTQNAILEHTWSSRRVSNLWLNDLLVGETGLNSALCGHYKVPVIMISGDQAVCAEAMDLLGPIEVAVVKQATSRFSALCLAPEVSQQKICEASGQAILKLNTSRSPNPLRLSEPIEVRVEFFQPDMADRAEQLPGSNRLNSRQVAFTAPSMPVAYRGFQALVDLAAG